MNRVLKLAVALSCLAILIAGTLLVGLESLHRSVLVTTFPGPPGTTTEYELWYAKNGDLELRGDPTWNAQTRLVYNDYYDSLEVKTHTWKDNTTLMVEMENSAIITFTIGKIDVDFATTRSP